MIEHHLIILVEIVNGERCPTCGGEPDADSHLEDCPRINTCGQYGPPWFAEPWHPEADFTDCWPGTMVVVDGRRRYPWLEQVDAHKRTPHEVVPWPV